MDAAPFAPDGDRVTALARLLEQERQRNATLGELFEKRGREIDDLRAEVARLREHEGELSVALQRVGAGAASGTADGAASAVASDTTNPKGAAAASEAGGAQAAAAAADDRGEPVRETADPTTVAALEAQLSHEQQRRQAAETELARLKEETSTPALGDGAAPAGELASANQEIVELRRALADERAERERMAQQLTALRQRGAEDSRQPNEAAPEDADLRARIRSLQAERDAVVDSFNRSLATSQRRTAELEQELAMARASTAGALAAASTDGTAPTGDGTAMQAENAALRNLLEDEHQRTEKLAAKLKLATRVTDLIFRMQAQQVQAQAVPVP